MTCWIAVKTYFLWFHSSKDGRCALLGQEGTYMPFKIFFIIQLQDLTSLSLKETIIFCQFLKDISTDFKNLVLFLSLQAKATLRSDHTTGSYLWIAPCNVCWCVTTCNPPHSQVLVMLVCIIWSNRYSSFPHMLCLFLPLSITIRSVYFPICAFYIFSGETFFLYSLQLMLTCSWPEMYSLKPDWKMYILIQTRL